MDLLSSSSSMISDSLLSESKLHPKNAFPAITAAGFITVTLVRLAQLAKAIFPMLITWSGMITSFSLLQLDNAISPIDLTQSGITNVSLSLG